MKKILIFFSLLITTIYLGIAIDINLSSGDTLTNSSWQEASNITNKISLSSNNLVINGKLVSSGKICVGNTCLGECDNGKVWDNNSSSCIVPAQTPETSGLSCKDIKKIVPTSSDGVYYIDPNGGDTSDAFQVYCDMTTDGGGWILIANLNTTQKGAGIVNGTLTTITNLTTYGNIKASTGTKLYPVVDSYLFKSGNYKYKLENAPGTKECLKGTRITRYTPHGGTVTSVGAATMSLTGNVLACNPNTNASKGWRFGGSQDSGRVAHQLFNNYSADPSAELVINGTRSAGNEFTVWVR